MLQVGASETNPGLDLGELRLDLAFAYGAGSWTGPRPCGELPAAACRQTEGAALQQEQSLDLLRVQAGGTLGLPVGLQFTGGLPVDLRVTRTRWSSGGLRLTPEWSGSDAFDGVTGGLGDVQLLFGIVDSPVGGKFAALEKRRDAAIARRNFNAVPMLEQQINLHN